MYAVVPIRTTVSGGWGLRLGVGLALTAALLVHEVRGVGRSRRPLLRAVRALVATVMVFLIVCALTYVSLSTYDANAFSEHLSKVSAFYFAVTTLATVGYGDITPLSDTARVLVTVQMIADLAVLALTARILFRAASGVARRGTPTHSEPPDRRSAMSHTYRIMIAGHLGAASRAAFDGLEICETDDYTEVVGDLDQAALFDLVHRVQSMALELVQVAREPA